MSKVNIRLTNECGKRLYLKINYFPKRKGDKARLVDNYYLVEHHREAARIPVGEARRWMREAKMLAGWDGEVVVKAEYLLHGKPTTLKAAENAK